MITDDFNLGERQGITLRLNHAEHCQVHTLRTLTGEATQSRAIMTTVRADRDNEFWIGFALSCAVDTYKKRVQVARNSEVFK